MHFVDEVNANVPMEATPNLREIFVPGGRIVLERRNPYGFVHVVWNSGKTPEVLSGAYSDFDTAREAVELYMKSNTFTPISETPIEIPVLRMKKVKHSA